MENYNDGSSYKNENHIDKLWNESVGGNYPMAADSTGDGDPDWLHNYGNKFSADRQDRDEESQNQAEANETDSGNDNSGGAGSTGSAATNNEDEVPD
jgi:hypothetical protein